MNHRLKMTVFVTLCFCLLVASEGFHIRKSWRQSGPSFQTGQSNPYHSERQEDSMLKRYALQPVETNTEAENSSPTPTPSATQEDTQEYYPTFPVGAKSRVIVSKTQIIDSDIIKDPKLPIDKTANIMESKDLRDAEALMNPMTKIDDKKDVLSMPLEKMTDIKETSADKVAIPVAQAEDVKLVGANSMITPSQKIDDLKDMTVEKVAVPGEKLGEIKNGQAQLKNVEDSKTVVVNPMEKIGGNVLEKAILPLEVKPDLKQAATGHPLDKMDSIKETTIEKVVMPEPLEKLAETKGAAKDMTTEPKANIMPILPSKDAVLGASFQKLDAMSNLKATVVSVPVEKLEEIKGNAAEKVSDPMEKVTDSKKTIEGSPLEKLGEVKEVAANKVSMPIEKVQDAKNVGASINAASLEKAQIPTEAVLDKVAMPMDKAVTPMDKVAMPIDKMTMSMDKVAVPMDKAAMEKVDMPMDKIAIPMDKVALPMEKVDMPMDKMAIPMDKVAAPMDKVAAPMDKVAAPMDKVAAPMDKAAIEKVDMPMDKMAIPMDKVAKPMDAVQDLKDAAEGLTVSPAEKKENVLEKGSEMKDVATDKVVGGEIKDIVANAAANKGSEILTPRQDIKDIVHDAFQQSMTENRKENFKQAISGLNKEVLADFYEALLDVFISKGRIAPQAGELKKDFAETVPEKGSQNQTNSTLIPGSEKLVAAGSTMTEDFVGFARRMGMGEMHGMHGWPRSSFDSPSRRGWGRERRHGHGKGYHHHKGMRMGSWGWGRRNKRFIYGIGTPSQELHKFTPPSRLRMPMKTTFRQINSAAPPDPYPRSKDSLSLPILSINEPATDSIMMDIKEGLQYVLQTRNDWTFAIHGTGTTGCHAVLDNLIEDGDKVLALINGYWGELMGNMSTRLGANVVRYTKSPGTVFNLNEIETALQVHRPDLVVIVQGESSTGVNQPLDGIGDLCAKNGALLAVDVVAVAGMQPVLMDKNQIDAVFTSSNKGLGGVAGLTPISLSSRAVQRIKNRLTPPRAYQTDLALQAELWNTRNPDRVRFQSYSLPLLYSLREALATIAEERVENTYKRHALATEHLNRGLEALGLDHFVENPKDRLVGITAVKPPKGKDPVKIANYMFKNYNIEISSGFGPTRGQVIRIATFASNANISRISNVLRALKNALNARETSVSY